MLSIRRAPSRTRDRHGRLRSPVTEAKYRRGKEPPNKGRKYPAQALRRQEVLAMINACPPGKAGCRNRALLTLLWRTGLRVAEAVALYPADLDLAGGRIHVGHGKGDKARTAGIDPGALPAIVDWLSLRAELGVGPTEPVFCTISRPHIGEPLFPAYVRNMVKDAARRGGLDPRRRVHPHALRHTHAFELLEEGLRLDFIRRQLGHTSTATTARYLEHLNPAEVVAAIRARPWPDPIALPTEL